MTLHGAPVRISEPGRYEGYTEAVYDGWNRSSVYVPMRDGVRLAADIVRPTLAGELHDDQLPVLWTHTPYTRAVIDPEGRVEMGPIEGAERMLPLVAHGYVVVVVDVRGGGASFGRSDGMFSPAESRDAYEVTEWLAEQPWSDGNIGMFGRSYLGITQYLCAAQQPPHLKAIFPEMAWWDAYDVIYPGGIMRDDLIAMWSAGVRALDLGVPMLVERWDGTPAVNHPAAPVDADADQTLIRDARREHFTNRNVMEFAQSNPHRDSSEDGEPIWTPRSPGRLCDEISASGAAVYNYGGWYDGFTRDACLAFAGLDNPSKLTIDPNYHTEMNGFDLAAEQRRWFDYWLKGIDNGIMDEAPVTYWLMGAGEHPWRTAPDWPVPGADRVALYLDRGPTGTVASTNDGALADRPAAAAAVDRCSVDYSTTTGQANRWANLYGGEGRTVAFDEGHHLGYPDMAANDARGLTWTAPALPEDRDLVGHPSVHLWVEADVEGRAAADGADRAEVDFFAYLEEVSPDGFSRYITEGCLRLSHRATGAPPYEYLGLPWHPCGADDVSAAIADAGGGPVELAFDLQPVATRLRAGHRLRLTVTGADQASHRTPRLEPPAVIGVHRGSDYPSRVEIPVIGGWS